MSPVNLDLVFDLTKLLSDEVPLFQENTLSSLGLTEKEAANAANPDEFAEIVREKLEEIPSIKREELLLDSIKRTRETVFMEYKERHQQAHVSFMVALITLIFAIALVFLGIILIFIVNQQVGVVTSVSSIVSGIVSGLAFTFNKQTADRIDEYAREMNILDKSHVGMEYTQYITDVKKRDEAITDLIKKIISGN